MAAFVWHRRFLSFLHGRKPPVTLRIASQADNSTPRRTQAAASKHGSKYHRFFSWPAVVRPAADQQVLSVSSICAGPQLSMTGSSPHPFCWATLPPPPRRLVTPNIHRAWDGDRRRGRAPPSTSCPRAMVVQLWVRELWVFSLCVQTYFGRWSSASSLRLVLVLAAILSQRFSPRTFARDHPVPIADYSIPPIRVRLSSVDIGDFRHCLAQRYRLLRNTRGSSLSARSLQATADVHPSKLLRAEWVSGRRELAAQSACSLPLTQSDQDFPGVDRRSHSLGADS